MYPTAVISLPIRIASSVALLLFLSQGFLRFLSLPYSLYLPICFNDNTFSLWLQTKDQPSEQMLDPAGLKLILVFYHISLFFCVSHFLIHFASFISLSLALPPTAPDLSCSDRTGSHGSKAENCSFFHYDSKTWHIITLSLYLSLKHVSQEFHHFSPSQSSSPFFFFFFHLLPLPYLSFSQVTFFLCLKYKTRSLKLRTSLIKIENLV